MPPARCVDTGDRPGPAGFVGGRRRGGHVNEFFFSRPSLLWQEFVDMVSSGLLARHLSTTGQEAGLGLLFGGVLGTWPGWDWGSPPGSAGR